MMIDFHTHSIPVEPDVFALVNLELPLPEVLNKVKKCQFSAGIHPWQLLTLSPQTVNHYLVELEKAAKLKYLDMIGECGLDRTIKLPLIEQQMIFFSQIKLAEQYQLPLIVHCVRAYSELIANVKTYAHSIPWIIHGFNGNIQQLEQCLKYKNLYFSFGPALLRQPDKFIPLLKMVPKSHLLLETDDSDTNIMDIYQQAAKLLGCGYEELIIQMKKNGLALEVITKL
jgi:TatD DNase family protein